VEVAVSGPDSGRSWDFAPRFLLSAYRDWNFSVNRGYPVAPFWENHASKIDKKHKNSRTSLRDGLVFSVRHSPPSSTGWRDIPRRNNDGIEFHKTRSADENGTKLHA
jgi:hypothetical protein